MLRQGHGTPSSSECLDAFMFFWVSWAGYPKEIVCDRGLNNRGAFKKGLDANGVYLRNSGLEAPEQIGRGERHGGILKDNAKKLIKMFFKPVARLPTEPVYGPARRPQSFAVSRHLAQRAMASFKTGDVDTDTPRSLALHCSPISERNTSCVEAQLSVLPFV